MANPENASNSNEEQGGGESAHSEIVEIDLHQGEGSAPHPDEEWVTWEILIGETVTFGKAKMEGDNIVRPMRESLRKLLKPPYNGQPLPVEPPGPPEENPPS